MTVGGCGVSTHPFYDELVVNIDKGGDLITAVEGQAFYPVTYSFNIIGWAVSGDTSGDIVVDVRKAFNTNPTSLDSIAGTNKPTLSSQAYNASEDLSSWSTSVAKGDVLGVSIDSVSALRYATVTLKIIRC